MENKLRTYELSATIPKKEDDTRPLVFVSLLIAGRLSVANQYKLRDA